MTTSAFTQFLLLFQLISLPGKKQCRPGSERSNPAQFSYSRTGPLKQSGSLRGRVVRPLENDARQEPDFGRDFGVAVHLECDPRADKEVGEYAADGGSANDCTPACRASLPTRLRAVAHVHRERRIRGAGRPRSGELALQRGIE